MVIGLRDRHAGDDPYMRLAGGRSLQRGLIKAEFVIPAKAGI